MRVLVVDDEPLARRRLCRMLDRIGDIQLAGEAADGIEARDLIGELRPDIVLLDIDMPELDGISLARQLDDCAVIFTTAHAQHAVEAFELEAVDYLLKPITQTRLQQALDRVGSRDAPAANKMAATIARVLSDSKPPRVSARAGNSMHVFDAREIERFFSSDKYTLFVHEGREYVLDESLSALEERLEKHEFLRVHRGELVNLASVKALHLDDGVPEIETRGGQRAQVSRRLLATLKRRLGAR